MKVSDNSQTCSGQGAQGIAAHVARGRLAPGMIALASIRLTWRAPGALRLSPTAEASYTKPHKTAQTTRRFAFGQGLHQFLLNQPMRCPWLHQQVRPGRPGEFGANVDVVKGWRASKHRVADRRLQHEPDESGRHA